MSFGETLGLMLMGFLTTAGVVFGLLFLMLLWQRLARRWHA